MQHLSNGDVFSVNTPRPNFRAGRACWSVLLLLLAGQSVDGPTSHCVLFAFQVHTPAAFFLGMTAAGASWAAWPIFRAGATVVQ